MGLSLQHAVDHAVDLDGFAGEVAHLLIPAGHHLVKVAKTPVSQRLGLGQEYLACGGIAAAIKGGQQDAGEVDKAHAGATVAPLAGHGGLDAADGGVVVGILHAHPELDELGDHHLVVVEGGHAEAAADHLNAGVEEILAHPGVVAHREVGLGGSQLAAGLQNRVGEAIDRVMGCTIPPVLAADGDVLIERAAGGGFGVGAGADLVHLQQLEPAPLQQFDGARPRQGFRQFHLAAIPGVEVLIHPAKRHRVTVGFDLQDELDKVAELQRLPEGLGGLVGDVGAVERDGLKLVSALGARFLCCHIMGKCGVARDVIADCLQGDGDGVQELLALQIGPIRQIQPTAALGHLGLEAIETQREQLLIVDREVGISRGHVALGLDDAALQQRFLLVGKEAEAAILHRLAAPEGGEGVDGQLVCLAHRKAGAGSVRQLVDLLLNPAHRVLRKQWRRPYLTGLIADDKLVVLDPDGARLEVMSQRKSAAYRQRPGEMSLIGLGVVAGTLGADRWLNDVDQALFVGADPRAEGIEVELGHDLILWSQGPAPDVGRMRGQSGVNRGRRAARPAPDRADPAGHICPSPGCGRGGSGSPARCRGWRRCR